MAYHSVYCKIADEPIAQTRTIDLGVSIDLDRFGSIVGVEVLGVGAVEIDGQPVGNGRVLIHPRYAAPDNGAPVDFNG